MEAVNSITNAAATAAKAVWGDQNKPSGEEPRSGEKGDTSKGEPYDKGNIDEPNSKINTNTTDTTSADFSKNTGTTTAAEDTPENPSTNLKAERERPADSTSVQNDVRDPSDPNTDPRSAPTDVNDREGSGVNKAQKLDGPGPKPLDEVANSHGGDAGNKEAKPAPGTDSKPAEADEHKNEGTGEKHVKTTGLNADGGDFDATKPGAALEADRIMSEKGIHNPNSESKGKPDGAAEASPSPSGKEKRKSIGQRIKDKLHRH